MTEQKLTHINDKGEAHMVDVAPKAETKRTAIAEGCIYHATRNACLDRIWQSQKR